MKFFSSLLFSSLLLSGAAGADAIVSDDGGIELYAYFMYPPSQIDVDRFVEDIAIANGVIWDATDEQMFIRRVTLTDDPRRRRDAQVLLVGGLGRAISSKLRVARNESGKRYELSNDGGARVMTFRRFDASDERGTVFGHELGHLVLGLSDEYPLNENRYPTNGNQCNNSRGPCIDSPTATNDCIMDDIYSGFFELCTDGNHDILKGDGLDAQVCSVCDVVDDYGDPVCGRFSRSSGLWETTNRRNGGVSCWHILAERFPAFIVPPTTSVEPDVSGPPPAADVVNEVFATRGVVILTDVSGSMTLGALNAPTPLCTDNNGDGVFDNQPCSQSRFTLMKDALDLFIAAARSDGLDVGLKSFNGGVADRVALQPLTSTNQVSYTSALASVNPGGSTAIGSALLSGAAALDTAGVKAGRSLLLITDGENTAGPNPVPIATQLLDTGTRIFTTITGSDAGVGSVPVLDAEDASLNQVAAPNASYLRMALLEHWASITGRVPLTPALRYSLDSKLTTTRSMAFVDWPAFWRSFSPATKSVKTGITVPAGTASLDFVVAEFQDGTRALDVTLTLATPSGAILTSSPTTTSPGLTVTRRNGFALVRLTAPAAGSWIMTVSAPTSGVFTGQFQVFAQMADVFSEVWSQETAPNIFRLQFNALIKTPLEQLGDVRFNALSRTGELITVTAVPNADDASVYEATLDLRGRSTGLWSVLASAQVTLLTVNEPGEPLSNQPSNSITLPRVTFTAQTALQSVK